MSGVYIVYMKFFQRSLKTKIIIGYAAGVLSIIAFILLSWSNLSSVGSIDASGDVVSELFDTTLEIRRYEKNYFLYRTEDDKRELYNYLGQAGELLDREELLLFTSERVLEELRLDLRQYGELLQSETAGAGAAGEVELETYIRDKGKKIVATTEEISARRNIIKGDALDAAKRNLVIGITLLFAGGLLGGLFFYSKAVKPLAVIEGHMQSITDGEFSLIGEQFNDRELISLKSAFNKMLIELRERQDHLVQSEKLASIGTLMFGVAHELNNPLSNISTSSQILREELGKGDLAYQQELIDQVEEETDRARDVVGSLLEFTRTRDRETFSLRRAVDDTIRLLKAEIPKGIRMHIQVPEDLELFADKQKIQQVILNLLQNAIDATHGEGEVRIVANSFTDHGDKVEIVVIDDGMGMEKKVMSSIFDPFFTRKADGHGLGLFIVHNIIEEHGGTISVDSNPGKGTSFSIVLPAKEQ
ncbi:MAG: HAMP domain-containing protein [Gaiellales bacterium]|nr:MAG: HAMP domain-containing protein [Gaiellales bacterium]